MAQTLDEKIEEIRGLMETRMRMKGRDLRSQVRRAGRLLPRRIRRDMRFLMQAADLAENPKLARMVDAAKIDRAHRDIVTYLGSIDPKERMWTQVINVTASVALALIVVFVLVLYVLVQRGFV